MVKPRNLNLAVLRNDPNEIYEGTCLSTDTKPTNWPDNSILFELDTGTRYYSNSGTWYPVGGGDDSGSGGGGGGVNAINITEIPVYTTEVDGNEFTNNDPIVILLDELIMPTKWFVTTAPLEPVMLYEPIGDTNLVVQHFPLQIGKILNYEADFSGEEVSGIYLMTADELTLYFSESFDNDKKIFAFITNPTFRIITN